MDSTNDTTVITITANMEHLSSPPDFSGGSCYSIFSFMCMFCRSLFVLLPFFFWTLCCLFFFDKRIHITVWYLQTLLNLYSDMLIFIGFFLFFVFLLFFVFFNQIQFRPQWFYPYLVMLLNTPFNSISFISWRSALLVEETGVPGE